jgi:uncharacterized membrane protein (DUF441 family)
MGYIKNFVVNRQAVISAWVVSMIITWTAKQGLELSADQVLWVTTVVTAVLSWLARNVVYSAASVDQIRNVTTSEK